MAGCLKYDSNSILVIISLPWFQCTHFQGRSQEKFHRLVFGVGNWMLIFLGWYLWGGIWGLVVGFFIDFGRILEYFRL